MRKPSWSIRASRGLPRLRTCTCRFAPAPTLRFLGGLINYAVQNNRIANDYLINYTNAAFIIKDGFKLPEDGLYSGFDPEKQVYDKATWNYEEGGDLAGKPVMPTPAAQQPPPAQAQGGGQAGAAKQEGQGYQGARSSGSEGRNRTGATLPPKLPLIFLCSIRVAFSSC